MARFGTGEKAATIGLGAATLGMAGGLMLSDPGGAANDWKVSTWQRRSR